MCTCTRGFEFDDSSSIKVLYEMPVISCFLGTFVFYILSWFLSLCTFRVSCSSFFYFPYPADWAIISLETPELLPLELPLASTSRCWTLSAYLRNSGSNPISVSASTPPTSPSLQSLLPWLLIVKLLCSSECSVSSINPLILWHFGIYVACNGFIITN